MTNLRRAVFLIVSFYFFFSLTSSYFSFADELLSPDQNRRYSPAIQRGIAPSSAHNKPSAEQAGNAQEEPAPFNWFERLNRQLTYDTFEINPRVRTEYMLDSNVFLDSRDAKMDSIFRESPGVEVVVPFASDQLLKADYYADFEQFVKYPKEDAINQYLASELALNFNDMFVRVNENLKKTSSRSGTQFTERVSRFENDVDSSVGYRFKRTVVKGGYDFFYRKYDSAIYKHLDYHANKFYSGVAVETGPKTNVTLDYAITDYDYTKDNNRDGLGNQILAGFAGHFLPKTSFFSKFGYEHIGYKRTTDANNFVAEVSANYRPFASTNIDLGWTRSTEQSTFSTTNFFRQDLLFMKWKQGFTEKVVGTVDVSYANQDYEQEGTAGPGIFVGRKRDDNLFSSGIKFSYLMNKWVSTDVAYQYSHRESNASIFDYTDHLVTVGLTAQV